ncbi:mesoderm induction early response protein 1 isoform X3 [Parasteatoda tepidariorum]|uniref:mesoderm induction early response protein 1 isoform X3 n=1 Tax=Parasteatoda tepidariorum TaxID=114398 RepID=UPI00077FD665|nr:mesoderm induction early response protein 1 isoform X3 [Parasteatoda tepidariorum]
MAEPSASESSADSDQDFDPTAEMLVNDFDDEHTLDEEEAMESAESVTNELDDLQREGEMPLNEVLAMYGYESGLDFEEGGQDATEHESDSSPIDSPEHTLENHDSPHSLTTHSLPSPESESNPSDEKIEDFMNLVFQENATISCSRPLLRSVHQASESSDTGTDYDYSPDDDWRKHSRTSGVFRSCTIQVGSDYQAVVPEGLSKYDDAPAYENEDRLLWDPTALPDEEVEDYLRQCRQPKGTNGSNIGTVPTGGHVRDDEQALFLLLQCGHNKEEALRRRRMQPCPVPDTMSLWSEDECRSFEAGIKLYGKDFHLIQLNKVRTRAVSELVQFYYLWKKTERHDVFASKNRIEKKKYALHPGTTDFMDRFLDEQENPSSNRDRSSSPSSRIPIYDENKKLTPVTSPETNADSSTPELSMQSLDNLDGPSSTSTFSTGTISNSAECENSPNKNQSANPSDSSRDYINGDDKVSSTTPALPKEGNSICLNLETLAVNENIPQQVESEKTRQVTPPSNVSCSHVLNDVSRFHEDCNFRFDIEKDNESLD